MKNEIKEILEQCNGVVKRKIPLLILAPVYTQILLDYITNLQQENENNKEYSEFYKDMSDKWKDMSDVFKKSCEDYKSRIEKANWWLKEMLKQAKSEETKAIINGTLELLLNGGDKE